MKNYQEQPDKQDFYINMKHLACIRGVIGYWSYYSTVMTIKDIVENQTIITVPESEELFTTAINDILQREVNPLRIRQISNYIGETEERFFSNLIVAFHKGEPKWTEVEISNIFEVDNIKIDSESIISLSNKFGVLTLSGEEEMFALDGQHRLLGIRDAYEKNNELGKLEIGITFVIHKSAEKEKTRRLFTVLNKYAEKPKGAELIILDEDDASAINTRRLVTEHNVLSLNRVLSSSKTGAIGNNDFTSLTTLVTINKINNILYSSESLRSDTRPDLETLNRLYTKSVKFWDFIFETFPELISYVQGNEDVTINGDRINRNDISGGSLLLRPVGHELLAYAYMKFVSEERQQLSQKLKLINFNLSSRNWKYIFWNDKMLAKESKLKNDLILYLLGKHDDADSIHSNMVRIYLSFGQEYNNFFSPIVLT